MVLASLSPFALHAMRPAASASPAGSAAATAIGIVVLLAGSRASWMTYAPGAAVDSGWKLLGCKKLLAVFALGALALVLAATLSFASPQVERAARAHHGGVCSPADEGRGHRVVRAHAHLVARPCAWRASIRSTGIGARGFRQAFAACDPQPGELAAWGEGPGVACAPDPGSRSSAKPACIGLLLWLAGAALAWRAWRYADRRGARSRASGDAGAGGHRVPAQHPPRVRTRPSGAGVTLMLSALYAGSLLGREQD
jgi:hypothetical protein